MTTPAQEVRNAYQYLRDQAWAYPLLGQEDHQTVLDQRHTVQINGGSIRLALSLNR